MRFRSICIVLVFMVGLPMCLKATHIVGGEMTYTCLGNDQYEIRLTIFRDCFNGIPWFDNPASIGVFNSDNQYLYQILVPLDSMLNDTLNPNLNNDCLVIPPNVCVNTTTYTTTAFLPFTPGGYQLVYQRCCRNNTIANLIAPEDVGATYSINISEEALQECNSSPVFNDWPPLFLCANIPFEIDQSAVDSDGDSLVYILCNPLTGATPVAPIPQPPNNPPYDTVPWLSPYNVDNMINNPPTAMPMSIDPVTGLLTGTPNLIGQFVIGICVEEYRNGELIGVNRRDYQVNIGQCEITTAAFFAPDLVCDSYTVDFVNQSSSADEFQWTFNDPANPGASSTLPNPSYTYSDTGLYEIMLIAEPNSFCADTFIAEVHILPNSLTANFSVDQTDCLDSLTVYISDASIDTASNIVDYQWVAINNNVISTSSEINPTFSFFNQGEASITLTVTAENGCTRTLTEIIPVNFILDELVEDTTFCRGDNTSVELNPDGGWPGATYQWSPPETLDNPNSPNPIATPTETTTYTVTITDSGVACVAEKSVTIIVSPDVDVTPVIDTILNGQSVQIMATEDSTYIYEWSPPEWLDADDIPSPLATPGENIVYTLMVTDENGCIVERTVTIIVLTICEDPFVFIPTGFSPNGDGKNDEFGVIANNIEELYLAVYDRWGELVFETTDPDESWDGSFKGKKLPPDVYAFYAEVRCVGGLEYFKKGNVTLLR